MPKNWEYVCNRVSLYQGPVPDTFAITGVKLFAKPGYSLQQGYTVTRI